MPTQEIEEEEVPGLPETGSSVLGLLGAVTFGLTCMLSCVVIRDAKRNR